MPKFDSHPPALAPEMSNPAVNGSAGRLTAVSSYKPHGIRRSQDVILWSPPDQDGSGPLPNDAKFRK
jgi:hypothetical protein